MIYGFEPVFDENSEILILGSFPSVKSREVDFYYGNKQNRFWNVLRRFYGENFGDGKREKVDFLLKKRIALWDAVSSCEIVGSSDSSIKNYTASDLNVIFSVAKIKKILLNGKKSYEVFLKNYSDICVPYFCLPSTSPANAKFNKEAWYEHL